MDYKLAEELKGAGFPQEPKIDISGIDGPFFGGFYYICRRGVDEVAPNFLNQRQYADYSNYDGYLVKIPTLSELIEACGEDFSGLVFMAEKWIAASVAKLNKLEIGSTPEEAVAHLWLALNNHDKA